MVLFCGPLSSFHFFRAPNGVFSGVSSMAMGVGVGLVYRLLVCCSIKYLAGLCFERLGLVG